MEFNYVYNTDLNNWHNGEATLDWQDPVRRSQLLWDFKLAWHLVQAAGYHFLFLIIARSERNAQYRDNDLTSASVLKAE